MRVTLLLVVAMTTVCMGAFEFRCETSDIANTKVPYEPMILESFRHGEPSYQQDFKLDAKTKCQLFRTISSQTGGYMRGYQRARGSGPSLADYQAHPFNSDEEFEQNY